MKKGEHEDLVTFVRSGVKGTLRVCAKRFELNAKLGMLLGAFKDRIENEIVKNLDELMAAHPGPNHAKNRRPEGATWAHSRLEQWPHHA